VGLSVLSRRRAAALLSFSLFWFTAALGFAALLLYPSSAPQSVSLLFLATAGAIGPVSVLPTRVFFHARSAPATAAVRGRFSSASAKGPRRCVPVFPFTL
jgi:hypothetical protein